MSTDYSSYILQYYCQQQYLDLYTRETFEIYTPDGTIDSTLLATIQQIITNNYPTFDLSSLEEAKSLTCATETTWWLF